MRYLFLSLILILSLAHPVLAQDAVDPGEAAFASEDIKPAEPAPAKPAWMNYQDPYVGEQNDIANPNKTQEEIIAWAQQHASEALSFTPETLNAKIIEVKRFFSPEGWTQYVAYLREVQMVELVRDKKHSLATIFNGDATVMNSQAVGGAYRWLVSAPLMITFGKKDAEGKDIPVHSGKYRLLVQVGRSTAAMDGLMIESWKIETATPAFQRR